MPMTRALRLASWILLLVAAVLAWPATASAARASLADSIASLLPTGTVPVDILTPRYSPRMQEIALRIDKARRTNPRFFQAWIARHPGGPPPWNPAFGVTRAEYDEYLREGRTASFTVRTHARLEFKRDPAARRWTLRGWGLLKPVDGLVIDVDRGLVTTPRAGRLPLLGSSAPDDESVALHWQWYAVWKARHVVGDPVKGGQALQASLHVGPLDEGSSTGLYWVMRRFNKGRRLDDEFLLLRFRR